VPALPCPPSAIPALFSSTPPPPPEPPEVMLPAPLPAVYPDPPPIAVPDNVLIELFSPLPAL
jgi:hypothetical protein